MVKSKRLIRVQILISWTAVLLWMGLIFKLSSQVAQQSAELSSRITQIVMKLARKIMPISDSDISKFDHIVRKNAHFFIYLVLGLLVMNALRRSKIFGIKMVVFTLLICALYASSDEMHQLLVSGRSGQVKDVFIDSAGAITGICLYGGVINLRGKKKKEKSSLDVS
ncbi:MAG TPA: VanZ family protein [Clostridiaceae bacterium]